MFGLVLTPTLDYTKTDIWWILAAILGIILLILAFTAFKEDTLTMILALLGAIASFILGGFAYMFRTEEKEKEDTKQISNNFGLGLSFGCSNPETNACCPGRLEKIHKYMAKLNKSINQIETICKTGTCDAPKPDKDHEQEPELGFGCNGSCPMSYL